MSTEPQTPEAAPVENDGPDSAIDAESAPVVPETDVVTPEEVPDPLAQMAEALAGSEDRHMRLAAEFENFKKRTQRENSEFKKYANESLLKEMLGVLDNFDRAIEHADEAEGDSLLEGVTMIQKQFTDVLEKFGVKVIAAQGEIFNPSIHQAVSQVETDEVASGHVSVELQRGFYYNERVLRPAMVVVAK